MKRAIACMVLSVAFVAACGGNSYDAETGPASVAVMSVVVSDEPAYVGEPTQASVTVTLTGGDEINGITTHFVDPLSGEEYELDWYTSNEGVAFVDQYARLIPRSRGFVEVSARMGDLVRSRVVRVDDPYVPMLEPLPDVSDDPEDPINNDPVPPEACRGHAVDVVSFTPGQGAGFGGTDFPDIVLGPPEGKGGGAGGTDVLSLGRLGEIVLDLGPCILVDGEGIDLIVFENAFFINGDPTTPFAELGIVGVSDDGVNFTEFACDDVGYPFTGCAGWHPVYSSSLNAIGPFDVANAGGDQFDLATIGVASARYVRIRDISDYGSGTTAGFDLDAVSVINGESL